MNLNANEQQQEVDMHPLIDLWVSSKKHPEVAGHVVNVPPSYTAVRGT